MYFISKLSRMFKRYAAPFERTPFPKPTYLKKSEMHPISKQRRMFNCYADHAMALTTILTTRGFKAINEPPLLKLFTPDGPATWLIGALDPIDPDLAFGLIYWGEGSTPELGTVRLSRLANDFCGPIGCPVERDPTFLPKHSLAGYASRAREEGRIRD